MFRTMVRLGALVLVLFAGIPALAQIVTLQPNYKMQYFSSTGAVLSGGCVFSYQSGTTTPLATYTDFTGGTPNPNPVVLGTDGRPPSDIWLLGQAYRIKLYTTGPGASGCGTTSAPNGTQIYSEDGVTSGSSSIFASANTWTGINTWSAASIFNGLATFNSGFTTSGPATMTGGGTLSGTFLGTPTFAGTVNFSGGLSLTTLTMSGQLTSTVATGTSPFVIASTTAVPNLNSSLLLGCTWAIPCAIGSTTPNTGAFTTLSASTSLQVNGGSVVTGTLGSDVKLPTAGTLTGSAGTAICLDANGGITTSGCGTGFSKIQVVKNSSPCTVGSNNSYDTCTDVLTFSSSFADTAYVFSCTGVQPAVDGGNSSTNQAIVLTVKTYSTSTITVITQNNRGAAAHYTEEDCVAIHP